jgi:hypothetical protein
MAGNQLKWKYGENDSQYYYEVKTKDLHCVVYKLKFRDKDRQLVNDFWIAYIETDWYKGMIFDKAYCDRQRKKLGLPKNAKIEELHDYKLLGNKDPNVVMRKVEYCLAHKQKEITP